MNDLERELRELLDERSRESRVGMRPAPKVLRRARRRQVWTVLGTVATVVAVVGGSIAGVSALVGEEREPIVTTPGSTQTRTSTVYGVTITYPEDWYLVQLSERIDETRKALFQITNFDPGEVDWFCPTPAGSFPDDGVILYLEEVGGFEDTVGYLDWPVDLAPLPDGDGTGCTPTGSRSIWTEGGRVFQAFLHGNGDAYARLSLDVFGSMRFGEDGGDHVGGLEPRYVLASVDAWNLTVNTSSTGPEIGFSHGTDGSSLGAAPLPEGRHLTSLTEQPTGDRLYVWGLASASVDHLVFTPASGPGAAEVVDIPPSFDAPYRAFVAWGPPAQEWTLTAFDASGDELERHDGAEAIARPPEDCARGVENPRAPTLPLPTTENAQAWLRNALAAAKTIYADCGTYVLASPASLAAIEPSLTYDTSPTSSAGTISVRDVDDDHVMFVTADADGNAWCIADDMVAGTTTYGSVDALAVEECSGGWQEAPGQATPEHGGTYWGVYVELGTSFDDPEIVAAELRVRELGYMPSGGDIACDEGAVTVLDPKTGEAWTVVVYFDTQAGAEAFAAMLDPPAAGIAKVTTYCLD